MEAVQVDLDGFPYALLARTPTQKRGPGNPKSRKQNKPEFLDVLSAFDIETTRLVELEQSIMYIWQWAFYRPRPEPPEEPWFYVVVGRTWDEFLMFRQRLEYAMQGPRKREKKRKLCCWVHNLSFEFAYLRGIWWFAPEDVFAIKARKILRVDMENIEFRCSYLHCNMSLDEYLQKMGVEHKKIEGYAYDKIRYPWTELSSEEIAYCVHDVVGLVEALDVEMQHDGDNLYTIPPTSTGYVRRDAKRAMREVSRAYVQYQLPDYRTYELLREAFRGGDTHANRYFVGQTVFDVHSADRSSSYPDIVCNCKFPVSEFFFREGSMTFAEVMTNIVKRGKAAVMRVAISRLELADPFFPAPYLSTDKCRNVKTTYIEDGETRKLFSVDNGRILEAAYLETTVTDVDLRVIAREYKWKDIVFFDVAVARYGPLPQALKAETIKYYEAKTGLKNVPGQEVYYTKSKNKLNAIYGMMAQDPVKRGIIYTQDGTPDKYGELDYYPEDMSKPNEQLLEEHNKRAFLVYQWGCWITAWARYRLREAIWTVLEQGGEFLYCDTDSVKYLGTVDFGEYNRQRVQDSRKSGAHAADPSGEVHYMGVMEQEHDMLAFKTWGAKKYIYAEEKKGEPVLTSTIAGVAKSAGAEELCRAGGFAAFEPGFVFTSAGGLEAVYNDAVDMELDIEGHKLRITPNLNLRPSSYTLGLAGDFERLLQRYKNDFDYD